MKLQPYSPILVVDDSTTARKIVRELLYALGFTFVREAADGARALELLAAHKFELVISDLEMGPVDGLTLLRIVRRSACWHDLPFIMMTGSARHKYVELARDGGATFFLMKPFTAEQLRVRIAAFGDGRHAA